MILFIEGWAVQGSNPLCEVEFMSWASNITHHCTNRAFFTTKQGRIGLGPSSMVKGDKICVFQGMPWPAVLRWNGERVRLHLRRPRVCPWHYARGTFQLERSE